MKKPEIGLLHAPALGRADEVDVGAQEFLVHGVHVPCRAEAEAARPQRREAGQGVGMEVALGEDEFGDALRLPALVRGLLVDERLADVEDDDAQSHPATVSRSASEVTLSSRGSPSTTLTRPPAASTCPAQSVACNTVLLGERALRSVSARNA